MKTSSVLLSLGLAAVASAQLGVGDLPTCAQGCANGYLQNGIGNCGTDIGCICANAGFISGIACCLEGVCSPSDQTSAVSLAQVLCTAYGVSVPNAVSGACTSSPTTTGTGSKSTPASTSATTTGSTAAQTTGTTAANSSQTTGANNAANTSSSTSKNAAPRPTGAAAAGMLGGLVAAVAML